MHIAMSLGVILLIFSFIKILVVRFPLGPESFALLTVSELNIRPDTLNLKEEKIGSVLELRTQDNTF